MANEQGKVFASLEEELEELGKSLNDKQLLFSLHYSKTLNATVSYQRAYDCKYTTAMVEGCKHLVKPKIKAYIDVLKRRKARDININDYDILEEYKKIAFADMNDYVEVHTRTGINQETGEEYQYNQVLVRDSDKYDGSIVTEIVKDTKGGIKVKLADKLAALKFLSNYTNMLNDDEIKQLQAAKLRHEVEQLEKQNESKQTNIVIVDEWGNDNESND